MTTESKRARIEKSILTRQTPEHSAIRSRLMRGNRFGEKNKGKKHGPRGFELFVRGYRFVHVPEDAGIVGRRPGGWVAEHILVMERAIGRFLSKGELIHHVDGNKQNNEISNLFLAAGHAEHRHCHASLEAVAFELVRKKAISFEDGRYVIPG